MNWIGFLSLLTAIAVVRPAPVIASHKLQIGKKLNYQPSQHVTPKTERDRQLKETSERLKDKPSEQKKAVAKLREKFNAEDRRIRHGKVIASRISTLQEGGVYHFVAVHLAQKITDRQLGSIYQSGFEAHFDHQLMKIAQPLAIELSKLLDWSLPDPAHAGRPEVRAAGKMTEYLNDFVSQIPKAIKWQMLKGQLLTGWQAPRRDPQLSDIGPKVAAFNQSIAEWRRMQADDSVKARADRAELDGHFRGLGDSYQDKIDRQIRAINQPRSLAAVVAIRERALAKAQALIIQHRGDPRYLLELTAPKRLVTNLQNWEKACQNSYADIAEARETAKKVYAQQRSDERKAQLAAGGEVARGAGLAVAAVVMSPFILGFYTYKNAPKWWEKRQARVAQASAKKRAAMEKRRQELADTAEQRKAEEEERAQKRKAKAKERRERRKLAAKNFGLGLRSWVAAPFVGTANAIMRAPANWQKFQQERADAAARRHVRKLEKRRAKEKKRAEEKALSAEEKARRRQTREEIEQFNRTQTAQAAPAEKEVVKSIVVALKRRYKRNNFEPSLQNHQSNYDTEWAEFQRFLTLLQSAQESQESLDDKRPAYAHLARKQKAYFQDLGRHPIKLYDARRTRNDDRFAIDFRDRTCRKYNYQLFDRMARSLLWGRADQVARAWAEARYSIPPDTWRDPDFTEVMTLRVEELLAKWKATKERKEMRRRLLEFQRDASLGKLDQTEKPIAPHVVEDRVEQSLDHMALWDDFSVNVKESGGRALAKNLPDTFLGVPLDELLVRSHGGEVKDADAQKQAKIDLVWNQLLGLGLSERVKDYLQSGKSDYGLRAVSDLLRRYAGADVVGLEEAWLERKRQQEIIARTEVGDAEDQETASEDENKLLDSEHRGKFQRNIYQPFPAAVCRHVDAEERCHCGQALDWDLVHAGELAVEGRNVVRPFEYVQVPGPGTHKFSSCGHLICSRCAERRFQESLTNLEGSYTCPTCKVPVPFWDLNPQRRREHFGIDDGNVRHNFETPRNRRLQASLMAESESWLQILQDKVGKRVGKWESLGLFFGSRYEQFALNRLSRSGKQRIRELATPVLAEVEDKKATYHQDLDQFLAMSRGAGGTLESSEEAASNDRPFNELFEKFSQNYQKTDPLPVNPARFSDFYAFARHHSGDGVFDSHELAYIQLSDTLVPQNAIGALASPARWDSFIAKLNRHFDDASDGYALAQLNERRAFLEQLNSQNRRRARYTMVDFHHKPLVPPEDSFRPYGQTKIAMAPRAKDNLSQSSGLGQTDVASLRDGYLQEVRAASIALEGIIEGEIYRQSAEGRARLTDAKKRVRKGGRSRFAGEKEYFKGRKIECREQIDAVADDYFAEPMRTVADLRKHLKLERLDNRWRDLRAQHRRQLVEQKKLVKGADLLKDEGLRLVSDRLVTAGLWRSDRGLDFTDYIEDPRAVDEDPLSWGEKSQIRDRLIAVLMDLSDGYAQQLDQAVAGRNIDFAQAVASLKSRKEELLRSFDQHIDVELADIAGKVARLHTDGALRRLGETFQSELIKKLRDWRRSLRDREEASRMCRTEIDAYKAKLGDASLTGLDVFGQKRVFVRLRGEIGLRVLASALRIAERNNRSDSYLAREAREQQEKMQPRLQEIVARCKGLPEGAVRDELMKELEAATGDCNELEGIARSYEQAGSSKPESAGDRLLAIAQRHHDTLQKSHEIFDSLAHLAKFSAEMAATKRILVLGGSDREDIEDRNAVWDHFLERTRDFTQNLRPGVSESEVVREIAAWTDEIEGYVDQVLGVAVGTPLNRREIAVPPPTFLSPQARIVVWESLAAGNLAGPEAWALYEAIPEHQRVGLSAPRSEEVSGLENLGATCFINSIIKAFATTSLYELLRPGHQLVQGEGEKDGDEGEKDDEFKGRLDFKAALFEFVNQVRRGEKFLDVAKIVDRILALKPDGGTDYYTHRDAQEYLALVLNQLDGMRVLGFTEKTTIERLNQYGDVETSEKSEPGLMLTLPIGPDGGYKVQTLPEVLKNYTAKSTVDDPKAPQTQIEVHGFGETVIVHLVRFGNEGKSKDDPLLQKNAARVAMEKLTQFSGPLEYRLEGAFLHYGIGEKPDDGSKDLDFGHFTFLEQAEDRPVEHNDEQTLQLAASEASSKAYTGYVLIFACVGRSTSV